LYGPTLLLLLLPLFLLRNASAEQMTDEKKKYKNTEF
jgi:hypothetical protein